jgi:hypothetical protein
VQNLPAQCIHADLRDQAVDLARERSARVSGGELPRQGFVIELEAKASVPRSLGDGVLAESDASSAEEFHPLDRQRDHDRAEVVRRVVPLERVGHNGADSLRHELVRQLQCRGHDRLDLTAKHQPVDLTIGERSHHGAHFRSGRRDDAARRVDSRLPRPGAVREDEDRRPCQLQPVMQAELMAGMRDDKGRWREDHGRQAF